MVSKVLFYYLHVQLEFEDNSSITKTVFKECVLQAIKTVFGEFGTCIPVDILKYDSVNSSGILRCPVYFYCKLRAALTVVGNFDGRVGAFSTLKSSPNLLSLVANSRTYNHVSIEPES